MQNIHRKVNKIKTVKWIVRLAFLAGAAWFLHPLYAPPKPRLPATRSANDFVGWTYHSSTNPAVVQSLTVYGDGRSTLRLTRVFGDPNTPEIPPQYRVRQDKVTGLVEFTRENALPVERAKALVDATADGGVIESRNIPAPVDKQLEVRWSFGGEKETSATGPQQLSTTFDWLPAKWVRLLRWRDLVNLVQNDSTIRPLLQKREFTLVDDHGQPVSNTP